MSPEIDEFLRKKGPEMSHFSKFTENIIDAFSASLQNPNLIFHLGEGGCKLF